MGAVTRINRINQSLIQLEPLENMHLEPPWSKIMGGSKCRRVIVGSK